MQVAHHRATEAIEGPHDEDVEGAVVRTPSTTSEARHARFHAQRRFRRTASGFVGRRLARTGCDRGADSSLNWRSASAFAWSSETMSSMARSRRDRRRCLQARARHHSLDGGEARQDGWRHALDGVLPIPAALGSHLGRRRCQRHTARSDGGADRGCRMDMRALDVPAVSRSAVFFRSSSGCFAPSRTAWIYPLTASRRRWVTEASGRDPA